MKTIAQIALLLLLTGCATFRRTQVPTFGDAVRASVETRGSRTDIVILMEKDGRMTIAERPITLDEISNIATVQGLPVNPPSVLIRADGEAPHENVKACLDALSKSGIWKISFAAVKPEDLHNKGLLRTGDPRTARQSAEP